ncbi:stage III sporulation protein AB [Cohnella pontilimi]|uniref:Stage III sporulation protein AB n=1 Tax=Cohnella pontilimi TaxID=2564100 RepID=A0A4U0FHL7_9BACL|nr:stage III sporulation protein SpoIIIAB [Cohnella pontilimi]TJY44457.1 stage III sporulation protein AB [Cohnella pontilimi]
MMKLAGALLVLFAGTMIGYLQAARFAARPRQIRQLTHALQRLETEIQYGQTPLPEAIGRLAAIVQPPVSALFAEISETLSRADGTTVRECWDRTLRSGWSATSMKKPEMEAMLRLGATLGGSGREDQIKHIRLAMHQLQAEEVSARDEQHRYEKMSRSLGVLGAALVVIIML